MCNQISPTGNKNNRFMQFLAMSCNGWLEYVFSPSDLYTSWGAHMLSKRYLDNLIPILDHIMLMDFYQSIIFVISTHSIKFLIKTMRFVIINLIFQFLFLDWILEGRTFFGLFYAYESNGHLMTTSHTVFFCNDSQGNLYIYIYTHTHFRKNV